MDPGFLANSMRRHEERVQDETVSAIVDYLRHVASGYSLMRSVKANGARDALYGVAEKLERDWRQVVPPRTTQANGSEKGKGT